MDLITACYRIPTNQTTDSSVNEEEVHVLLELSICKNCLKNIHSGFFHPKCAV